MMSSGVVHTDQTRAKGARTVTSIAIRIYATPSRWRPLGAPASPLATLPWWGAWRHYQNDTSPQMPPYLVVACRGGQHAVDIHRIVSEMNTLSCGPI